MLEGDGVRYNNGGGRRFDDFVASVVVERGSKVEAFVASVVPGVLCGPLCM